MNAVDIVLIITSLMASFAIGCFWYELICNDPIRQEAERIRQRSEKEALLEDAEAIAGDWAAIGFGIKDYPMYFPKKRKDRHKHKPLTKSKE